MTRLPLGRAALAAALAWALAPAATAQSPQTIKINEYIQKGYESAGIKKPAARATDHEFLRRVYIDLLGRIATPEEVIDFERDTAPDKRARLVQRLLYSDKYTPRTKAGQPVKAIPGLKKVPIDYANEYAEHWADIWTVWLMTRTGHPVYRDEMRTWLEVQFSKGVSHRDMVVKLLTATGRVGDDPQKRQFDVEEYAANFIIHHLGEAVPDDTTTPDVDERKVNGRFDAVPITSRVTKLFLGLQTQCTQCHDHPFNKEWQQADFWGVNGFFRQTVRSATPSGAPGMGNNAKMLRPNQVALTDDPDLNAGLLVPYERRDGRFLKSYPTMLKDLAQAEKGEKSARVIDERFVKSNPGKTRRQQLAEWVVSHDNFSKAYVSRVWAHFFGRGLNKEPAADDFGSHNEVVHPDLLHYLGEEFAKYNYDPKKLMEWVCTSDVYQLSHVANPAYVDIKYDPYFARMPLKAMSPEVLFESLMVATRGESRGADQRKALRDAWMRKLVRNFGDDEGNELSFNGTVVQALLMMNGAELNGEIGVGRAADGQGGVVLEVVKKHTRGGATSPRDVYDELFLMTLNRHPTSAEIAKLEEVRTGKATVTLGPPAPKGPAGRPAPKDQAVRAPGAAPNDVGFYQDVLWALLNTNEFMLNH